MIGDEGIKNRHIPVKELQIRLPTLSLGRGIRAQPRRQILHIRLVGGMVVPPLQLPQINFVDALSYSNGNITRLQPQNPLVRPHHTFRCLLRAHSDGTVRLADARPTHLGQLCASAQGLLLPFFCQVRAGRAGIDDSSQVAVGLAVPHQHES